MDVYEDDGASARYLAGETATTRAAVAPGGGAGCDAWSVETRGAYAGMSATRAYALELGFGDAAPARVTQGGAALPRSDADGVAGSFFYAGDHTNVYLQPVGVGDVVSVVVCAA